MQVRNSTPAEAEGHGILFVLLLDLCSEVRNIVAVDLQLGKFLLHICSTTKISSSNLVAARTVGKRR